MRPLLELLRALHEEGVRAVVVGGVAVLLHGHVRATADLDLVLDLSPDNVQGALAVLEAQGLVPRLPVQAQEFADPEVRDRWRRERHLTVFALHDPDDPRREVDLFAEEPLPFAELWESSVVVPLSGIPVRVASRDHLIEMKRAAGRPQDLADVAALEALQAEEGPNDRG